MNITSIAIVLDMSAGIQVNLGIVEEDELVPLPPPWFEDPVAFARLLVELQVTVPSASNILPATTKE